MKSEGTCEHAFGGGRAAGGGVRARRESTRPKPPRTRGWGQPHNDPINRSDPSGFIGEEVGDSYFRMEGVLRMGYGDGFNAGVQGVAGVVGTIAFDLITGLPGQGSATVEYKGVAPSAAPNTAANTRATTQMRDQITKNPGVAQQIENVRPPKGPDLRLAMVNTPAGGGTPLMPMVAADPASGAAAAGGAVIVASYPLVQQLVKLTMQGAVNLWKWIHEAVKDVPHAPDFQGEPGSTVRGQMKSREYGEDGYPKTDRELPHPDEKGPGCGDHCHDWGRPEDGSPPTNADRGPGRIPVPGDPPIPRDPGVPPGGSQ